MASAAPTGSRPACEYGKDCYRLNADHLKYKQHPHLEAVLDDYIKDPKMRLDPTIFNPKKDETNRKQLDVLKAARMQDSVDVGQNVSQRQGVQTRAQAREASTASVQPRGAAASSVVSAFGAPMPKMQEPKPLFSKPPTAKNPSEKKDAFLPMDKLMSFFKGKPTDSQETASKSPAVALVSPVQNGRHVEVVTSADAAASASPAALIAKYTTIPKKPGLGELCPICQESDTDSEHHFTLLNICSHAVHEECLSDMLSANNDSFIKCPVCNEVHGILTGKQPKGGSMTIEFTDTKLPGYEESGSIEITYAFKLGIQESFHPNPGEPFKTSGFPRRCYLPNTDRGRSVLDLLKTAFRRRLTFTVGTSSTTGKDNVVVFNGIHHKTKVNGDRGYPDDSYLARVEKELKDVGVVAASAAVNGLTPVTNGVSTGDISEAEEAKEANAKPSSYESLGAKPKSKRPKSGSESPELKDMHSPNKSSRTISSSGDANLVDKENAAPNGQLENPEVQQDAEMLDGSEFGDVLTIPPERRLALGQVSSSEFKEGIIVDLSDDENSLIRPIPYTGQLDVAFDQSDIRSVAQSIVSIAVGSLVKFVPGKHNATSLVIVNSQSQEIHEIPKNKPRTMKDISASLATDSAPLSKSSSASSMSIGSAQESALTKIPFKTASAPKPSSSSTSQANGLSCSFQPRALNFGDKKAFQTCTVFSGTIATVLEPKKIGFIRCKSLPPEYAAAKRDVFFHFNHVRNIGTSTVTIGQGSEVDFVLEDQAKEPKAYLVFVDSKSDTVANEEILNKNRANRIRVGWSLGEVISADEKKVFLMSEGKRVFMHADKISRFALPLKVGDKLEFIPNDRDPKKPSVLKVKHHDFAKRSSQELKQYFKSLLKVLPSSDCHRAMLDLPLLDAQWRFLTNSQLLEHDVAYTCDLLRLFNVMMEHGKTYLKQMVPVISQAVHGHVLTKLLREGDSAAECVLEFSLGVISHFPELAGNLQSTVDLLSAEDARVLLKSSLKALSTESGAFDFDDWRSMPSIPTDTELLSEMISEDKHLTPVHVKQGYKDEDQYMDTYFRLLRAESFNALQKGIRDFRNGTLDQRDMNVYVRVFLAGLEITGSTVSIGLQFKPVRPVRDWGKSQALIFGSLVCITPSQKFDDIIWATVSTRDKDLLNKSNIVFVQLCDFNQLSLSEIIDKLLTFGGNAIMVESPSYFMAASPVLKSFRKLELDRFQVRDEIVHVKSTGVLPGYLEDVDESDNSDNSDTDGSEDAGASANKTPSALELRRRLLGLSLQEPPPKSNVREIRESRRKVMEAARTKEARGLDEAQQAAFDHALTNRVAVIQGPPGTGKTFIGIKLVKTILKYGLHSPILVLTYKNHALDEFLKHTLEFCDKSEIVRIGGRSTEPELNECNLQVISQGARRHENFFDVRNQIDAQREESFKSLKEVYDKSCFSEDVFLRNLTDQQLESLLVDADWSKNGGPSYRVNKNTIADRQYVSNKLIPYIAGAYGSVKEFVSLCALQGIPKDPMADHCIRIVLLVLRRWMPDKTFLHQIKQMYEQFVFENEDVIDEPEQKSQVDEQDEGDFDEDYINEITSTRMSAMGTIKSKDNKLRPDQIVLLEMGNIKSSIFSIFDFPKGMQSNPAILAVPSLWKLTEIQRAQFLYSILVQSKQGDADKLETTIDGLQDLMDRRQKMEVQKKLDVLKGKKVIGMTITGASIHHDLIQLLRPRVVIVEEAAEILEPSLVAALNPHVQHLVLIGDHKQLRPQVDTYPLVKNFNFDVSMMERLISSGFPYKVLQMQNRMRPEFSALLKDIYPNLKDNMERVSGNKSPDCMSKSMFFWNHSLKEDGEKKDKDNATASRSKKNTKEAEMVAALVKFFLQNGYKPAQITVLAAYLGQRMELSKMIRPLYSNSDGFVQIQTIDTYQGDENDIVIVSLVRSNDHGSLGFLNSLNRRCVAQSRAKCGLYFVGNVNTLTSVRKAKGEDKDSTGESVWTKMINAMEAHGCVGTNLEIQCGKHKALSRHAVASRDELLLFVDNPEKLCKIECGDLFDCGLREHACKLPCTPRHSHNRCNVLVKDKFEACGHSVDRRCYEDINKIACQTRVNFEFKLCGHPGKRQCYVSERTITCHHNCLKKMNCELHSCPSRCGEYHTHDKCQAEVSLTLSKCGHAAKKKCCQSEDTVVCKEIITVTLPTCKHEMQKPCHVPIADVKCTRKCAKTMNCGLHACLGVCGDAHNHDNCKEKVTYCFPACGHPSKYRKECSEPIKFQCVEQVIVKCSFGHDYQKECGGKPDDRMCTHRPCPKQNRKCGHFCTNKCGEDCNVRRCATCAEADEKKLKEFKEQARKRKKEFEEILKNLPEKDRLRFTKKQIFNSGETKAEYLRVEDQVSKFVQPMHNWYPVVTKVEKVTNLNLAAKFEEAKEKVNGDFIDWKFHGTSDDGVNGICKDGFRLPGPPKPGQKPGMFGQGIYFATDSSKSAREIYTKGSNKLLLCKVLLGKSMEVKKSDNSLNLQKLRSANYDSVFAPRGSEVMNDEFVIFDPRQALPEYIIHYASSNVPTRIPGVVQYQSNQDFERVKLTQSRNFDPSDPKDNLYRTAFGHFAAMSGHYQAAYNQSLRKINHVEFIVNKRLEAAFDAKKAEFQRRGIPSHEVLAFHGTSKVNIDSILKNNLDPNRTPTNGRAHGHGCYFSEFPDVSQGYGDGLLLFRLLPGNEYSGPNYVTPGGYQAKKVNGNAQGFGQMIIITDAAQFVPYFVYHFN